jgi:hypothetical protein
MGIEAQGRVLYGSLGSGSVVPGIAATIQFMFVVGGPNNFASIPGAPAVPVAGDTSMTTGLIAGVLVRMSRGGFWQMGLNPLDGNTFYTKAKASNTINFDALGDGEEIIIETIPI